MKTGKSLVELATEIERQAKAKVDYVADTRKLEMVPVIGDDEQRGDVRLVMHNGDDISMRIGANAHQQIGQRLQIPAKYYERMLAEKPQLLAHNVNTWFREQPEARMVRTLDGMARAFLSNSYQRIDNNEVAEIVLPILLGTPGVEVMSAEITEKKLYIKAVTHSVRAAIKSLRVGDMVEAGVCIGNSEIGLGAVSVMPFFNFLWCTNGMVRNKEGMRSAHIGTKLDADENTARVLQDDTRKAIDRSVLLKVRDFVAAAMNAEAFNRAIEEMQATTSKMITGDPAKAIEVLAQDFALNETEKGSVLRHLITGGDISQYGVMNAVTRTAEDADSYDRATEIEALGGRVLDLPASQWHRYAVAA